ncbi:MAG: hypothetical protein ACTHMS_23620 [Jatrophihabitans sp.]|uniref:hypothetical protein n=1 Tax=Jatrophihabitans sp. TaxID=1932789 RepID=UPI003F802EE7
MNQNQWSEQKRHVHLDIETPHGQLFVDTEMSQTSYDMDRTSISLQATIQVAKRDEDRVVRWMQSALVDALCPKTEPVVGQTDSEDRQGYGTESETDQGPAPERPIAINIFVKKGDGEGGALLDADGLARAVARGIRRAGGRS